MAKDDDLADKVRGWLKNEGTPFEMRVAQTMVHRGLGTQQGHFYLDPVEGKSREIDVIASAGTGGAGWIMELTAVIECKYADSPWVVFRGPRGYAAADPSFDRIGTRGGKLLLPKLAAIPEVARLPIFQREPAPGYGMRTALKDTEQAYAAMHSATNASLALATALSEGQAAHRLTIILPVVALQGRLFESYLDDEEIVVREVDRAQVHWSSPISGYGRVLIDVVTHGALDDYATELAFGAESMFEHGASAAGVAAGEMLGIW